MSAVRRATSTRVTRLAAKASPYHAAVTLHDAPSEAGPSTRRRAKSPAQDPETSSSALSELESDAKDSAPAPRPKKTATTRGKRPAKTPKVKHALDVPHPAPANWAAAYAAIKAMRARIVAPVDTMGCDRAQLREREPKNQRFATLVSLMLSAQTKDDVTDAAVNALRLALGGALSVQAVLDADEAVIAAAIGKVGFWRRKTQYVKQTARRLCDDFGSDVPQTVEELCSLPGVGPKMAFLALQVAWGINVGIGVDVHVHRITNRLGWHVRPTKNPEETRLNLQSWLPKELHGEINHMLVGFGQTVCLPVRPKCGECTLSTAGLCPSAERVSAKPGKARKRAPSSKDSIPAPDSSGPKIEIKLEDMPEDEKMGPVKEEA